jgi:hypothetical protein
LVIAGQPDDARGARHDLDIRSPLVQERSRLEGALAGADHDHTLARQRLKLHVVR